jgi:hypothetical protein
MYSIFEVNRKSNRAELKQIKKIYLSSFPREERTPWLILKQDIKKYSTQTNPDQNYYCILIGIRENNRKFPVLGFAVLEYVKSDNFCFMGFIAINPEHRDKGIGSYFMSAINDFFIDLAGRVNKAKPIGFFYEINKYDLPRYDDAERKDMFARYRFYNRLNQKKLDVPYFQPALLPWYPDVPMYLMVSQFEQYDFLPKKVVNGIYKCIYSGIYRMSEKKLEKSLKRLNEKNWPEKIKLLSLDSVVPLG